MASQFFLLAVTILGLLMMVVGVTARVPLGNRASVLLQILGGAIIVAALLHS